MRWVIPLLLVVVASACSSPDMDAAAEGAQEAAVEYAVMTFGLATAGLWTADWAEGMEATDVYVSEDRACAAVLVQDFFVIGGGYSLVIVLASLDHFTIPEVIDAHSDRFLNSIFSGVGEVTELVGDRRWAPTFGVPFTGYDITLDSYREGDAMFGSGPICETIER
jgi:hypothetical protein